MNKIYNPTPDTWASILVRPTKTVNDIEGTVKEIFAAVQKEGDVAVAKYTTLFDGVSFKNIEVTANEIEVAVASLPDDLKEAIALAKDRFKKWACTFLEEQLLYFQRF